MTPVKQTAGGVAAFPKKRGEAALAALGDQDLQYDAVEGQYAASCPQQVP